MAGEGQAAKDSSKDAQVSAVAALPTAALWEVEARFVGFQVPKDWSMPDERGGTRSGVTYRVDVRVPEGTVLMKVPEGVYNGMAEARLDFGDRIAIQYGRTVSGGEMRVAPVGFRRL